MASIMYIICTTVSLSLALIEFLLFVRVIGSWIPFIGESAVGTVIYNITEYFLIPARYLLEKTGLADNSPIDFSVFLTLIVVSIIRIFI